MKGAEWEEDGWRHVEILVLGLVAALSPGPALAQSTWSTLIAPGMYTGTMDVTVDTYEDCDLDGQAEQTDGQASHLPVFLTVGALAHDEATTEANPFGLLIGPDQDDGVGQPGEMWLDRQPC